MPLKRFKEELQNFEREGRFRTIPEESKSGIIDLVSNDYLGLAKRANEFKNEYNQRWPKIAMTSSASRLLSVHQKEYSELENLLSSLYGHSKKALLFNSGYHANSGVINALALPGTLFIADRLIHASMIDGLRMSGAHFARFRHNDTNHLDNILRKKSKEYERVIILTESLFSMDGDFAPLQEIVDIKRKYPNTLLYLDEAHAIATIGEKGLGLSDALNLTPYVDIMIGTLGKGAASEGAFVITSKLLHTWLINSARSLIFSTAISPASAAWSQLMIEKFINMKEERDYLKKISDNLVSILNSAGINISSQSHIIPLIVGDSKRAVIISKRLYSEGINALPIRKPTVPEGTARLRLSLNASLSDQELQHISEIIIKVMKNEIPFC